MPNNTITPKGNYESIAMDTNAKQLYMLTPVFLLESALSFINQFDIPNKNIFQKAIKLFLPPKEQELVDLKKEYKKSSSAIFLAKNMALIISMATGFFMLYRAYVLENNLGNNEIADSDINYSWLTSWTGMIPSLTYTGLNITQQTLLSYIPEGKIFPTLPVEIHDPLIFKALHNDEYITLTVALDKSTGRLVPVSTDL